MSEILNSRSQCSVSGKAAAKLDDARQSFAACQCALNNLTSFDNASTEFKQAKNSCMRATDALISIGQQAVDYFGSLTRQKFDRGRDYREFRFDQDLLFEAKLPDVLKTLCFVMAAIFGEGTAAGFMLALEGHMGVPQGLLYGYTFASVNIALGVACGFLCVRYMDYRSRSRTPALRDVWIRFIARFGGVFFIVLMIVLVYSATRTRAMGGHVGIFNFDEIGVFEAFNDGVAIAIAALGILGSVISIYEGVVGFSDITPSYSKMRKLAQHHIDEEALNTKEALLDDADTISEDAEDAYLSAEGEVKQCAEQDEQSCRALSEQWMAHNNKVANYKDKIRVFARERSSVEGRRIRANLASFDEYLLPLEDLPAVTTPIESEDSVINVLDELEQAHRCAIATISSAYSDYLSYTLDFDDDFEEGEDHEIT